MTIDGYAVETVNIWDHARAEIKAARDADADPLNIAETHFQVSRAMRAILKDEDKA